MADFCTCTEDGWCPRFRRDMTGRFRAICRGEDVDLGTAAAFRMGWAREALSQGDKATARPADARGRPDPRPLLFKTAQAPGDAVVATAAIYSLHRAHPGRYLTAVESPWPEVFAHNPDVVPTHTIPDAVLLQMHYPAIHDSNQRGIHVMQAFCEFLGFALGVPVPLLTERPHLYFGPDEVFPKEAVGDYWLICSGGKRDFTNKLWGHHAYQEVVDRLPGITFVQVGAVGDDHPPLCNVENLVGKTTLRGLFRLCRHARGVLCGVSLLMHVAAALEVPGVIVAGGREPVAWNAYPKQQYVHAVGALPCTDARGRAGACWRSRVLPQGDHPELDRDPCLRPVNGVPTRLHPVTVPECMSLIRPAEVAALIMRYNGVGRTAEEDSEWKTSTSGPT